MSSVKTPYSQPVTPNQSPPPAGVSVYVSKEPQSSLWFWMAIALGVHVIFVFLVWLAIVIFQFFGWDIPLFNMAVKPRDVEFVLVDNSPKEPPRKPTNRRAEHASRSGGKKIANQPTQMPQKAAGAQSPRSTPRPAAKPQPKSQPQPRAATRPTPQPARPQPQPKQATAPTPKAAPPTPAPPAPKLPRPTKVANATPSLPPNPIAPTIRTPAPKNPGVTGGGPIVKTPGSSSSSSSSSSGGGNPGPSMIAGNPSRYSGGSPGSSGSPAGRGGSGGQGSFNQSGSPGGGGGRAGVDAMAEPDFGPYIAELQRRIRRNWVPPVEDRSKRVVALFKISRDGRLLSLRIQQSSGSPPADQAAQAAVRASAPFRPLPPNYKGNDIDVQFIFDYEIYGHGNAKMR